MTNTQKATYYANVYSEEMNLPGIIHGSPRAGDVKALAEFMQEMGVISLFTIDRTDHPLDSWEQANKELLAVGRMMFEAASYRFRNL